MITILRYPNKPPYMIIETEYNETDLIRGKCKSCGDKTLVLAEGIDDKHEGWCPDCIEAEKFEEMTGL